MTRVRVLAVLSALYFLACVVQVFLAGYGVFSGGDLFADSNSHMEPHRVLGNAMGVLALLVLVAAAFTRQRRYIVVAAVAFVLTGVTGAFAQAGEDHPWAGGVHALLALLILGAAGWLAHNSAKQMREAVPPAADA